MNKSLKWSRRSNGSQRRSCWTIWVAYLSLIIGLVLTFYFPRRRVWARLHGDHLEMAFIGDRYVASDREFAALLDDLSARLRNRPERRLQPSLDTGRQ